MDSGLHLCSVKGVDQSAWCKTLRFHRYLLAVLSAGICKECKGLGNADLRLAIGGSMLRLLHSFKHCLPFFKLIIPLPDHLFTSCQNLWRLQLLLTCTARFQSITTWLNYFPLPNRQRWHTSFFCWRSSIPCTNIRGSSDSHGIEHGQRNVVFLAQFFGSNVRCLEYVISGQMVTSLSFQLSVHPFWFSL